MIEELFMISILLNILLLLKLWPDHIIIPGKKNFIDIYNEKEGEKK